MLKKFDKEYNKIISEATDVKFNSAEELIESSTDDVGLKDYLKLKNDQMFMTKLKNTIISKFLKLDRIDILHETSQLMLENIKKDRAIWASKISETPFCSVILPIKEKTGTVGSISLYRKYFFWIYFLVINNYS